MAVRPGVDARGSPGRRACHHVLRGGGDRALLLRLFVKRGARLRVFIGLARDSLERGEGGCGERRKVRDGD